MTVNIDRLKSDVAAQTTVVQSVVTLLSGLQEKVSQIAAAAPDQEPDETVSDLDDLASALEANTQALAALVPQNTSAQGSSGVAGNTVSGGSDATAQSTSTDSSLGDGSGASAAPSPADTPSTEDNSAAGQPDTQESVTIGEGGQPVSSPSVDQSETGSSSGFGGSSGDDATQQGTSNQ